MCYSSQAYLENILLVTNILDILDLRGHWVWESFDKGPDDMNNSFQIIAGLNVTVLTPPNATSPTLALFYTRNCSFSHSLKGTGTILFHSAY